MNESLKSRILLVLCLCFGLVAAACSGAGDEPPLKGARLGGPFTLTDQNGSRVSETDFAGRYRIVYFGFSHCPDVCPTDLMVVGQAMRRLEAKDEALAARVQPLFFTVDPERDTPAALKAYVAAFHPRLIGLTGTPDEVAKVAKAHGIYYAKTEPEAGGAYGMDHSRLVMLFGPRGEPIALLPFDKGAEAVAGELERWVR
jgi:protein SCO1/2